MRIHKTFVTIAVVLLCAGAVYTARALRPHPDEILKQRIAERSKGDEKAPLWITEYFDYQCPPCATARGLLENALAAHPGVIRLEVRFFPLPTHRNGQKAALYAECVSRQKGKFWKFHEELFSHQREWAEDPYAPLKFAQYAQNAGADIRKLDACVKDPRMDLVVSDEKKAAEALGVQMTPSFFVNGKLVVGPTAVQGEIDAFVKSQTK